MTDDLLRVAERKKPMNGIICPTCNLDMNLPPNDEPNPCPQCGQGRGTNRNERFLKAAIRFAAFRFGKTCLSNIEATREFRDAYRALRASGERK